VADTDLMSAQVILSPGAAKAHPVAEAFRSAGFDVGPMVADNFSISGPESLFTKYFDVGLSHTRGGAAVRGRSGVASQHLPLDKLPVDIKPHVGAVVFTPPPDFGPGNY
jgi:hypothetical protein